MCQWIIGKGSVVESRAVGASRVCVLRRTAAEASASSGPAIFGDIRGSARRERGTGHARRCERERETLSTPSVSPRSVIAEIRSTARSLHRGRLSTVQPDRPAAVIDPLPNRRHDDWQHHFRARESHGVLSSLRRSPILSAERCRQLGRAFPDTATHSDLLSVVPSRRPTRRYTLPPRD